MKKEFVVFVFANFAGKNYAEPDDFAKKLSEDNRIESVNIITGKYELLIKCRFNNLNEYYSFIKEEIKSYGFSNAVSSFCLKEIEV